jgi:hypothetical protein
MSHFKLHKFIDSVAAVFIEYLHNAASYSLDLCFCMADCLKFCCQHSMYFSENVKCSESLHGRNNLDDPHIHILEDNNKIDRKKL